MQNCSLVTLMGQPLPKSMAAPRIMVCVDNVTTKGAMFVAVTIVPLKAPINIHKTTAARTAVAADHPQFAME